MTAIAPYIEAFLREHLSHHRGASQHTCDSYAYSFQLLFEFAARRFKTAPSALKLEQLDAELIGAFLKDLGRDVEIQLTRAIPVWRRSALSSDSWSIASPPRSNRFVVSWPSPSREPTRAWFRIWPKTKCKPCSISLIQQPGKGSETGPCYTWPYATACEYQN